MLKSQSIVICRVSMVGLQDALRSQLAEELCLGTSVVANGVSLGSDIYERLGLDPLANAAESAANFWRSASNLFCGREPDFGGSEFGAPFQGGQCDVLYNYSAQFTVDEIPTSGVFPVANVLGPLSYVTGVDENGRSFAKVLDGNGQEATSTSVAPGQGTAGINVTNVTRVDGQPDDCGNPSSPNQLPTYDPTNFNPTIPVTYDPVGGGPAVTINPTVQFEPVTISPTGEFSVPFDITFEDGSSVVGDINITTGDINFGGGNSGDNNVVTPERELPDGENVDDRVEEIVAVRVVSGVDETVAKATQIFSTTNADDLWVPRLATVRFLYKDVTGGMAYGRDHAVKSRDYVVRSDAPAASFVVQPELGVTVSANPIVRFKCDSCCG